jgi:deoxyribonuclease V
MIIAMDTYYNQSEAITAVVGFEHWTDKQSCFEEAFSYKLAVGDYVPGQFYQRELPPLLNAFERLSHQPTACIIDGYVWLDENYRPGLGAHLYEAIERRIPVIGIAKTEFKGAPGTHVIRGRSKKPLYVSAVGIYIDPSHLIQSMHGENRIPVLIKRADSLSRSA